MVCEMSFLFWLRATSGQHEEVSNFELSRAGGAKGGTPEKSALRNASMHKWRLRTRGGSCTRLAPREAVDDARRSAPKDGASGKAPEKEPQRLGP